MNKKNITLFVGDVDDSVALAAQQHDSRACLIDRDNYKEFLTDSEKYPNTVFTSLGDLSKNLDDVWNVFMSVSNLVYCPPVAWSDGKTLLANDPTSCIQGLTENLLLKVSQHRPVKNLEHCLFYPTAVPLADTRKTSQAQLWIAGCSITYGSGVNAEQRYGQLVANELDLSCSFLTRPGSSIGWAADQILRSDIRKEDIVIWGITATERLSFFINNQLLPVHAGYYSEFPEFDNTFSLENLYSETTFYNNLYAIEQVINYCQKNSALLMLVGLITSPNMFRYLQTKNIFFPFPYKKDFHYVDFGTDNQHPGPNQHQLYSNFILTSLSQIKNKEIQHSV